MLTTLSLTFLAAAPALAQHTGQHGGMQGQHGAMQGQHGAHAANHLFNLLPDGARIEVQSAAADAAAVNMMRTHLQQIARVLGTGEAEGEMAHMKCMPGAEALIANRASIEYTFRELPAGGELRITSRNAQAVEAAHQFVTYMQEHASGEHGKMMGAGMMQHGQQGGMQHGQQGGMQHGQQGGMQHGQQGGMQHGQQGGMQHGQQGGMQHGAGHAGCMSGVQGGR